MANLGTTFEFAAESAKLRQEIDKVRKELNSINATAKGISDGFKFVGTAIAGAFSIGAVTGFLKSVNSIADNLNDLSGNLGASASGLQSIQLAATLSGGSIDGANAALAKMNNTIGEAINGNKTASEAFKKLGISVSDIATQRSDEAFRAIIDKLSAIPNVYQRAAAAQDIFGKGAKEISGLLAEGGGAIDAVNKSLDEQGARLNELDTQKIGAMNDAWQFQQVVIQNLGIKFLSGLSPAVNVATGTIAEMIGRIGGATEAGNKFGVIMTFAIKGIEAGAYLIGAAFELVRYAVTNMLLNITTKLAMFTDLLSNLAKVAGLDALSQSLRSFTDSTRGFAESLKEISDSALANAKQALVYAKQAGLEMLAAPETFAKAQADADAKAEAQRKAREEAERNARIMQQLQEQEKNKKAAYDPNAARMSTEGVYNTTSQKQGELAAFKDPTQDPKYVYQQMLNDSLAQLASDGMAERLNIQQAGEASFLDSLLTNHQFMVQAEQAKNMTLGESLGSLAQMAIQQGGTLGKFGKAYAIASTVWSGADAIIQSYRNAGGYPLGIPAAAAMAATVAAQLANIKKTNIGSGGAVAPAKGGAGGGASSAALQTPQGPQKSTESDQKSATQIIINGSLFAAQETVDWLVTQIGEAVNGRDMVFINGNSRQALELSGAGA